MSTLPRAFSNLTEEEKDVMRSVGRTYFFTRCLPFSVGGALAARHLIRIGVLSKKYSFLKVSAPAIIGYMIGQTQALQEAQRRLLKECPNGNFARMVTEWKDLTPEQQRQVIQGWSEGRIGVPSEILQHTSSQPPAEVSSTGQSGQFSYQEQREKWLSEDSRPEPQSRGMQVQENFRQQPSLQETVEPVTSDSQFSYKAQREKWMSDEGKFPSAPRQETSSQNEKSTPQQPEFSYQTQREKWMSGGEKVSPNPLEPKVKRNKYGDEME